ncbi:MAG: response regulator [Gemmatimonadaceae bacterium]
MRPLVLLVEDDDHVRRAFRALLTREGIDVIEAGDAETGIAAAREWLPDLVLLDVQLPGVSGWNTARAIKEDPVMHRMAVVAVTGLGGESDRDASYAAGCDYHLAKPVAAELLLSTVRAILRERGVIG